jgi:apolipoprotein D and lipocalin family protein
MMNRGYRFALAAAGAVAGVAAVAYATRKTEPLRTVRQVDLNRYAGAWYEIAHYPNRFEKKCKSDTKAMYLSRDDGTVGVLNSCRKSDGTITSIKGTAKVVDSTTNAKLKVTFFWPFAAAYWILDLAPDYSYAVVGEPSRKYLWILSRTPQMDDGTYREITERIRFLGYDSLRLIKTKQSERSQSKTG